MIVIWLSDQFVWLCFYKVLCACGTILAIIDSLNRINLNGGDDDDDGGGGDDDVGCGDDYDDLSSWQ